MNEVQYSEFIFRAHTKWNELGIAPGICSPGQFECIQMRPPYPEGHNYQTQPGIGVAISALCYYTMNSPIEPCCR